MQSGCGTQHPHADACGLLAAAPTTAPCIRHWRRSLSLQAIPLPALPPAVAGAHPPDHLLRKLPAALLGKLLLSRPARGEFLRRMSGKWGPDNQSGGLIVGAEPWVPGCSRRKLPEHRPLQYVKVEQDAAFTPYARSCAGTRGCAPRGGGQRIRPRGPARPPRRFP